MRPKCIIVDDELPAQQLLQMYISEMDVIELTGTFDNAFSAFTFLQQNHADLMYLDIHMPRMSGLELLRSLRYAPKVVITTAFREYALDAFELDVVDYLLKPISKDRFLRSISKFNAFSDKILPRSESSAPFEDAYLFLKVGKDQVKVFLKDIQYIEGLKDYIKVYTTDRMIIAYDRLGYMEQKLPESHFVRVHKSFIIATSWIARFNTDCIQVEGREIPIGRVYKQKFMSVVNGENTM